MKLTIELPFFDGFYETGYFYSDMEYWAFKEELRYLREDEGREDLTEDDLDLDFKAYQEDVCDAFVRAWEGNSPSCVVTAKFDHLDSPRYYNYRNDEIYAEVELTDDWKDQMWAFMKENADWLRDRIRRDWSSRDGFVSFMDNDLDGWGHFLFDEEDERYISTMIAYMMLDWDEEIHDHLLEQTMEDVCLESYIYVKKDREGK